MHIIVFMCKCNIYILKTREQNTIEAAVTYDPQFLGTPLVPSRSQFIGRRYY